MVEFRRTMEPWLRLKKNKTCFFFFFWVLALNSFKADFENGFSVTDEKVLAVY